MFSKQDLVALSRQRHVVEVPVLGLVGLRRMTAKDMIDRELLTFPVTDPTTGTTKKRERTHQEENAFLIARVLIDESGERIFQDEDLHLILESLPLEASIAIGKEILRHNGLEEKKTETDEDTREKN